VSDRSEWLDPEEFPFSEAELQAALEGWAHTPGLEQLPGEIARGLRECRVAREEARQALARGSRDLDVINYPISMFPDEVWALMADLGPAHLTRVESFFAARRANQRDRRVAEAMLALGLDPRGTPSPEILAKLDAEDRKADEQWLVFRAQVRPQTREERGPGSSEGVK
jgi:hypothetical protein